MNYKYVKTTTKGRRVQTAMGQNAKYQLDAKKLTKMAMFYF